MKSKNENYFWIKSKRLSRAYTYEMEILEYWKL